LEGRAWSWEEEEMGGRHVVVKGSMESSKLEEERSGQISRSQEIG